MKRLPLAMCLTLALCSAAMADEPTAAPAAETSTTNAATDATSNAPSAATTAAANTEAQAEDDPIVCKTVKVTGSRVRKNKVCQPRSKWEAAAEAAQRMVKDNDRRSSPQAGGQTLMGH